MKVKWGGGVMVAMPLEKEETLYTYAEYKDWELGVGERFELIYGEVFAMAGPNERHQSILAALTNQFFNYLEGKPCKVYPAPFDVRLFYEEDESDDTVVQPDIMIICDKKKRGPESCRGAPDLVVEILSPSNTAIEMERKFELYRRAGVKEYWVIDPESNRLKTYHFEGGNILTNTFESSNTAQVAIFPDLTINLNRVFAE